MLAVIALHEVEQWTMHKIYAAVLRYKKQLRLISVVFSMMRVHSAPRATDAADAAADAAATLTAAADAADADDAAV